MKKLIVSLILLLSFVIGASSAQDLSDLALKRGVGVRAAGMGGAYTALADDASALFYNPAGLAVPGIAYTTGNPDTNRKHVQGTVNLLKLGYLGYGLWNLESSTNSDEVTVTSLGFGNKQNWLSWGMSYKDISKNISGTVSSGWSSDLGAIVRVSPQFRLGLIAQDLLTSSTTLVSASGRLGAALKIMDDQFTLAADAEIARSGQTYAHFGVETDITEGFTLRAGLNRGDPTVGGSMDMGVFAFDYAAVFEPGNTTVQKMEAGLKYLPRRKRPFSIIKQKEYVLIDVSGAIKGGRTQVSILGGVNPGVDSIIADINKAAKDPSVNGIMIKIGGFGGGLGGMAIVQEIRRELVLAKAKGKKVVAYIEGSALGDEYYLAAVADKIVAPPGAVVGAFGQSVAVYRIGGLYEKIGMEFQEFTQGKYKAAFSPYNESASKEQKEMISSIVTDLYRQLLTDVAKDRQIDIAAMKEMGEGQLFTAEEAKDLGLIDEIGYFKEATKLAAIIAGAKEKDKEASMIKLKEVEDEEFFLTQMFGVAVIEIDGEIVSGQSDENVLFGGQIVGSETVSGYIRQASDDVFIKAIILRINSPGGGGIAAGEIYEAIKYAKQKEKVVIASLGNIAASGGYYIACGADKIVANESSLTGSIGVIGYIPLYEKLYKKFGIKSEIYKEGKYSDMFSSARKLTTEEADMIVKLQKVTYDEFVNAVAAGRKIATEEVYELAEGRLYTGNQAFELKLVDKIGGFNDAIELAKVEAKLTGEPRLIFYHHPSWFSQLGYQYNASSTDKSSLVSLWQSFRSALGLLF